MPRQLCASPAYAEEVRSRSFPAAAHVYPLKGER
jgi:ketopantoate hydroxymethyltransferase